MDFDGSNDYILVSNNYSLTSLTLEAWFYNPGSSTIERALVGKTLSGTDGWHLNIEAGSNNRIRIYDDIDNNDKRWHNTTMSIGWHHAAGTVQTTPTARENTLYVDGVLGTCCGGQSTDYWNSFTANLYIGIRGDPTVFTTAASRMYFNNKIDEVRVSSVARSADWIKAQYLSMTDAFITYGSQEAVSCPPPQPFTPCNWSRRRKLTFNNAAQAENLVNFPVLVVLNSSRIDYGLTQNQGQDLRFTDSDGVTLLAHEIEKWDEAGTSYVWVKVPQIDASSTTDHIWMYYGNATVADGQDAGPVWSNGYAGVWHLGEGGNTTRQDSTCNNNDVADTTTVAAATGKVGGAADFVPTDYLTLSDAAAVGLEMGTQFTLEAWAKGDEVSSNKVILG
ncbi:MAG: DUF2341 domain-containing protein, partial [Nitrospiraceae bacterium]